MQRKENGQLSISKTALTALENQSELAAVDTVESVEDDSSDEDIDGAHQTALRSGFSEHNVFCFDQHNLYLANKDFMKLKKDGKIEIVEDKTDNKTSLQHISKYFAPTSLSKW